MKKIVLCVLVLGLMAFIGCASATSSVKGTMTTISTVGGNTYNAIVILQNSWEGVKIAKDDNGNFMLYANVGINSIKRPENTFFILNGKVVNIAESYDWKVDNISKTQYGILGQYHLAIKLNDNTINALSGAETAIIRVVNGNAHMGTTGGVDFTSILPNVKDFISN